MYRFIFIALFKLIAQATRFLSSVCKDNNNFKNRKKKDEKNKKVLKFYPCCPLT